MTFDDDGLAGLPRQTAEAAAAMEALKEPAARAAETAAPIGDPGLRAALEALAQNILTRPNSKEGA